MPSFARKYPRSSSKPNEKKGVTVKIDAELHAEVRRYIEEHEMTMGEFVSLALQDKLHPRLNIKEDKDWQQHSYIAMNGVYESAVLKALENHLELKSVYLCTDNDEGGIDAAERLRDILYEHGYADIFRIAPQLKDWNEQLKQLHGAEFLPAVPHERKELYLQSVSELTEMKINPNRIADDLIAIYNSADRIRLAEFSLAASEHFLKIAGEEFPLDRMKNRLTNEYRCYQDKGTVTTKLGKLQNAMTVGLEQLRKPSQTVAELKITARKLYNIADHALRLSTEETLVQRAEQKEMSDEVPTDEPLHMSMSV